MNKFGWQVGGSISKRMMPGKTQAMKKNNDASLLAKKIKILADGSQASYMALTLLCFAGFCIYLYFWS